MLQSAYRNNSLPSAQTFRWFKRFPEGRKNVDDEPYSRQTKITSNCVQLAHRRLPNDTQNDGQYILVLTFFCDTVYRVHNILYGYDTTSILLTSLLADYLQGKGKNFPLACP
jgi:hypothetical protein